MDLTILSGIELQEAKAGATPSRVLITSQTEKKKKKEAGMFGVSLLAGALAKKAGGAIIKRATGGGKKKSIGANGNLSGMTSLVNPFEAQVEAIKDVDIVSGMRYEIDPVTGELVEKKKRRRRRRMLTCQDKNDIAFLVGTLGKGQMAQAAVTAVLTRRCN